MTIKSHFNRSTTTKIVSRVPVSFEISILKSRLKETRLHYFFFVLFRGLIVSFWKKTHTHHITFHKTYSNNGDISWQLRVLSDGLSPMSLADVPRATSPVLGPPESSRSRALVAHAGLAIRQPPRYITWDIAANRHHYVEHRGEWAAPLRTK